MSLKVNSPVESKNSASGSAPGGVNRVIRAIGVLLTAVMFVLALDAVLILFTGGHNVTAFGITISGSRVNPPIILLLMLVILRFPLRQQT